MVQYHYQLWTTFGTKIFCGTNIYGTKSIGTNVLWKKRSSEQMFCGIPSKIWISGNKYIVEQTFCGTNSSLKKIIFVPKKLLLRSTN